MSHPFTVMQYNIHCLDVTTSVHIARVLFMCLQLADNQVTRRLTMRLVRSSTGNSW